MYYRLIKKANEDIKKSLSSTWIKYVCIAIVSIISFSSCEKQEVKIPPAVQELMNSTSCDPTCPSFVNSYHWRNRTVFIYSCGGPLCNCAVKYFNDNGEELTMEEGYGFPHFEQEAKLLEHIWVCK
jgi:hypothetical protein